MNNSRKRTLSFFLVIIMCISLLPASAFAEDSSPANEEATAAYDPADEAAAADETSEPESPCGEEVPSAPEIGAEEDAARIESITITSPDDTLELHPGDTLQLSMQILPQNVAEPTIAWASSDEKVLAVDERGLVTALSVGTAVITATAAEYSGIFGEI